MPFTNQTHPAMFWEKALIDDVPHLTSSYFDGAIEKVCITHAHWEADHEVEVLFRDGSRYNWSNTVISIAYNGQFGISVSKDGRYLFAQTWDKGLFCYDSRTGRQVWRTKRRFGITEIFINDTTLLVHQHDRALQLLDMETGKVLKEKKPARAWGFYPLDKEHLICHTCAKHWEIIRASDLETVEIISKKQFPAGRWRVRNVYLEDGKVKYEAFLDGGIVNGKHILEINEGTIETHYQEVSP